jgi:hypothetical protein
MNLVPGAIAPARNMSVPQVLQNEFAMVLPVAVVLDCVKTVRLSSPRVKRVWVSRAVKLVANMDAETFRQSAQWQTKVLARPGSFKGYSFVSSVGTLA